MHILVIITIILIFFLIWHDNIVVVKNMFWSRIVLLHKWPIPILHIWVKKIGFRVVEKHKASSFQPIFLELIHIILLAWFFFYMNLMEGIPQLALRITHWKDDNCSCMVSFIFSMYPIFPSIRSKLWQLEWLDSTAQTNVMCWSSTSLVQIWCPYTRINKNECTYINVMKGWCYMSCI